MVVFAFKDNISENIVLKLDSKNVYILDSTREAVHQFIDKLIELNPEYVLGLGEYSGRDQNKVRIELKCTNKFRNHILGDQLKTNSIKPFIKENDIFMLKDTGMGNSFCNLVSFLITQKIKNLEIKSKYTFLHIPRNFDIDLVVMSIEK